RQKMDGRRHLETEFAHVMGEIERFEEHRLLADRPETAFITRHQPELDRAIRQRPRLAAETAAALTVALGEAGRVSRPVFDFAREKVKATIAARADIAFIRKAQTRP